MRCRLPSLVLCAAITVSCGEARLESPAFHPVVATTIAELEREVGSTILASENTPTREPEVEWTRRIRHRVESIAGDASPLRATLVSGVQEFGDRAVSVLSLLIADPTSSPLVRTTAAEMLAALDSPDSAAALVYHARDNPIAWIRAQCAYRLAATNQDQVMIPLLEAIDGERDAETQGWIASTLARFGCFAFETRDPDRVRRWRFGDHEMKPGEAPPSPRLKLAVWKCLAQLAQPPGHAAGANATRAATIALLGRLPAFAADPCADALRDQDLGIRVGAAQALALMGPRAGAAGAALLESLEHDPELELDAVRALGAAHHTRAAEAIEQRLHAGARPVAVRAAAARALGGLDSPRCVPALREALDDHEPGALRAAAAAALIEYGHALEAVPVLLAISLESTPPDDSEAQASLVRWLVSLSERGHARAREILDLLGGPAAADSQRSAFARVAASIREALPELVR